jgi:hypothetical protein
MLDLRTTKPSSELPPLVREPALVELSAWKVPRQGINTSAKGKLDVAAGSQRPSQPSSRASDLVATLALIPVLIIERDVSSGPWATAAEIANWGYLGDLRR